MFHREVILCAAVQLLLTTTIETYEITKKKGQCKQKNITHVMYDGDVIKLKISRFGVIRSAQCSIQYSDGSTKSLTRYSSTGDYVQFDVPDDKNTQWNCTFENIEHERVSCPYNIIVKTQNRVTILMNDNALKSTSTKFREYGAEYKYQRGEIINTTCLRNPDKVGALQMKYFDANDSLLFATKLSYEFESLSFRSYMTPERNNSYLQCSLTVTRTTEGPPVTEVHRVHYIVERRVDYPLSVRVNGLELVPRAPRDASALRYEYHYVDGEPLDIVCEERNVADGYKITNIRSLGTEIIHPCPNMESAELKLISEFTSNVFQPHITRLRRENILYQHTENLRNWTTYYRYRVNETLRLACVAKVTEPLDFVLQWDYEGRKYTNVTENKSEAYGIKSIDMNITLDDDNDSKVIKCETNRILLKRNVKDETDKESANLILVTAPTEAAQTATGTNLSPINKDTPQEEHGYPTWTVVGSIFGCLVICGALCVPIVFLYKKRKMSNENNENYYNEITVHETPIPIVPEQWNEYFYAEYNSHYTEIDEGKMVENNCYHSNVQKGTGNEQDDSGCNYIDNLPTSSERDKFNDVQDIAYEVKKSLSAETLEKKSNHYSYVLISKCYKNRSDAKSFLDKNSLTINKTEENDCNKYANEQVHRLYSNLEISKNRDETKSSGRSNIKVEGMHHKNEKSMVALKEKTDNAYINVFTDRCYENFGESSNFKDNKEFVASDVEGKNINNYSNMFIDSCYANTEGINCHKIANDSLIADTKL